MSLGRLSYWEEAKVNKQMHALVNFGKMRKSSSKYACKATLLMKKDDNKRLYGNYRPLNAQTWRDSFPMPLIDDVLD